MKILEVRDGLIKFEADESVCLSSFVLVSAEIKHYVAQVTQINNGIACAKILFLYDGQLQPYDKTLPSLDSEIIDFTYDIINNSLFSENPIIIGETLKNDVNIIIDSTAFDKKMIASIDNKDDNNILIRNLVKQFNNLNKNVVIVDTLGIVEAKKYIAGKDFKLPLDTASLAFMYQDCLNDATEDSKSLIVEIFKDLSDYSKTVPFLPFQALKSIVDEMVDKSHVFKLLVLKNKLSKFDKLGYFAKDKKEVDSINSILSSKCAIIDISKLDSVFQNRYLSFLYEKLATKEDTQVILELSNTVSKKNLKQILSDEKTATMFVTHSRFKYLNDIKNLFDNFIITPSVTNNEIFSVFNSILKNMHKNSFLISGEAVNYMQLISPVKLIDNVISIENDNLSENQKNILGRNAVENNEDISDNEETNSDDITNPETIDFIAEQDKESVTESDIVEADTDIEQEEPVLTHEDIIANIEEKSEAAIEEISQNIIAPDIMFEDEDEIDSIDEIENDEELQITDDELSDSNDDEILIELDSMESEENNEEFSEIALTEDIHIVDNETEVETEEPALIVEEELVNDSLSDEILLLDNDSEIGFSISEESNENDSEIVINQESENVETESETEVEIKLIEQEPIKYEEENVIEMPEDLGLIVESNEEDEALEFESTDLQETTEVISVNEDLSDDFNYEEITELPLDDISDEDIIVDLEDDEFSELKTEESQESLDEQITKDVDKVFTTRIEESISESDLDFIDELNSDDGSIIEENLTDDSEIIEELTEQGELDGALDVPVETNDIDEKDDEEILETRNSSTPIVPVYDAEIPQEDLVISDPIEQGDVVTHAKYGSGIVEKMIKYGSKTLYSINFDNIGRRLLDPTLTEIKKG